VDDGAEVVLNAGDVLIENGTRHRWRVVGDVPATRRSKRNSPTCRLVSWMTRILLDYLLIRVPAAARLPQARQTARKSSKAAQRYSP
jgi:hypothetical protein